MITPDLNRSNVGAFARLALLDRSVSAERLQEMADICRQLGDLDAAVDLLEVASKREAGGGANARALLRTLLESRGSLDDEAVQVSPTPFVRRFGFLPAADLANIKHLALLSLERFVSSEIHNGSYLGVSEDTRRSVVLSDVEAFRSVFLPHLRRLLDEADVGPILGTAPLSLEHVELQVTGHGDGAYFKPHTDASSAANGGRELSYVFYFSLPDCSFSGGNLKLFDASMEQNRYSSKDFTCIEPVDNSLILFPSRCVHEVTQVAAPRKTLSSGRFSLNGWIHQRSRTD